MDWDAHFFEVAMIIAGFCCGFWMKKRKFDRTNESGVERFPSYSGRLVAKSGDAILGLLSISLIVFGVLAIAGSGDATSWGWIVLLPFSVALIYALT